MRVKELESTDSRGSRLSLSPRKTIIIHSMKQQTPRARAAERNDRKQAPPLRQRLRLFGRDTVLDAAGELFLKQGYRATTMADVAAGAGVGVATVFRYFKTKEGILAALSRRDIDQIKQQSIAAMQPLPADPADAMLKLFTVVLKMHEMPSTQIRGQTRLWLLVPTGHSETDEVVTSSDLELQDLIHEMLLSYRKLGRIQKNLDLRDMTITLFAVFYHHYLKMGLDRTITLQQVTVELARRIPLLFVSWIVPPVAAQNGKARARGTNRRPRTSA